MGHQRLRGRAALWWERAVSSLWFIPTVLVIVAIGLSAATLALDRSFVVEIAAQSWWLFGGTAEGARSILSVIAGSLITVAAVAFSVTMIAIQQASTQYSPRVLRMFTRDRGNQVVLGAYIATFTYALLILRRVRSDTEDGGEAFIPALSLFAAIVLALASLGLFVFFIHHASESLQVSYLLKEIRADFDRELEKRFSRRFGERSRDAQPAAELAEAFEAPHECEMHPVRCREEGYVRRIQREALGSALSGASLVWMVPRIGEYIRRGDVLARVWCDGELRPEFEGALQQIVHVDRDRSTDQDALFALRQLVDIALKALSPGINDPTTAEQAIDHLAAAVAALAERELPSPLQKLEGGGWVIFSVPSFSDYVDASFAQVRRAAKQQVHVILYLLRSLQAVADRIPNAERAQVLRHEVGEILAVLSRNELTESDANTIRTAAREVLRTLTRHLEEPAPPPLHA